MQFPVLKKVLPTPDPNRFPVKSWEITMDENRTQQSFTELFTQLREFADQHSLGFTIVSSDSDMKIFLVEMDGDGFQITSEAVLSPLRKRLKSHDLANRRIINRTMAA
jgi:hypothetical protein